MICSVCGEVIRVGEKYFEYFKPNADGNSEQVTMCLDCLNENLLTCDVEDEEEINEEEQERIYADMLYNEMEGK